MTEENIPGNDGTCNATCDKTVMENVELGTEQNVMESMMENTIKGSWAKHPRYKMKVQY